MNPSKKSEPAPKRYEQADTTPTSPVPGIGTPGRAFERPEGAMAPPVSTSERIRNPIGKRAIRAEAAASE